MKANELMIGDWICSSINDINVRIAPADLNWDNAHTEWLANSKPIPLTAEILEKNGFDCNQDAKTSIGLVYHECARITEYGEEVLEDGKMIRYVHELQHALKLCGIDKEIVL